MSPSAGYPLDPHSQTKQSLPTSVQPPISLVAATSDESASNSATSLLPESSKGGKSSDKPARKPRKPRAASVLSTSTDASGSNHAEREKKPRTARKGKEPARVPASAVIEIKDDEEDDDDDDPVFVGQAKARQLSKKFSFQGSNSVASSSSVILSASEPEEKKAPVKRGRKKSADTATIKAEIQARLVKEKAEAANLVLYPPKDPEPLPSWLGKTATLLALSSCPVCHQRWKRESGSARWRHISTCLPPPFRPPNPPPNYHELVDAALEAAHAPVAPSSLLDIHVASGVAEDRRPKDEEDGSKAKPKVSLGTGWRRSTRVRSAADRSEDWESEVSERVTALTEASPTKRPKRESTPKREASLGPSSPIFSSQPATQPLGDSSLGAMYTRPHTPSPKDSSTPPLILSQRQDERVSTPPRTQTSTSAQPLSHRSPSPAPHQSHLQTEMRQTNPSLSTKLDSWSAPTPPGALVLPVSPEQENPPLPPPSQKRGGRFALEALSPASLRLLGLMSPFEEGGVRESMGASPVNGDRQVWKEGRTGWERSRESSSASVELGDRPRAGSSSSQATRQLVPSASRQHVPSASGGDAIELSDDENDADIAEADEMDELEVVPTNELEPLDSPSVARRSSITATPVASSSRLKISPTAHRSPVIPASPSTTASFSPSRFEGSPTISPGVRGLSITPRNTFRPRFSTSVTPTAQFSRDSDMSGASMHDAIDFTDDDDDGWGGGAVLQWDGVDMTGDSASSVAPGDAGLDSEEVEEEEGEWGREAVLEYDWDAEVNDASGVPDSQEDESEEDVEPGGMTEDEISEEEEEIEETPKKGKQKGTPRRERAASESVEDLTKRGMPDYSSWELKRLQKFCQGFGYRPIVQRQALEQVATACWKALNPLPTSTQVSAPNPPVTPKAVKGKGKARAKPRQDSATSDDIPLSEQKTKTKGKAKGKGKQKVEEELEPIEKRFAAMVKGDAELYLRILQYAPIAFDELVSKCIRAGINDTGWKIALKKFLDFEGITFYTEDPTGQRRSRH